MIIVHALLLFKGHTAGPLYNKGGNTANFLCLHSDPQWGSVFDGQQPLIGSIWGASYGLVYNAIGNNDVFSTVNNGGNALSMRPAPCAVCDVPGRTRSIMIPARISCPMGWTKEYSGYLTGELASDKRKRSFAICVDQAPEITNGSSPTWHSVLYPIGVQCGMLPCDTFSSGKGLTCVVCTK